MLKPICGLIFSVFILSGLYPLSSSCDLLVFSFDRPMQLYSFLESLETRGKNLSKVSIFYRFSPSFQTGYEIVQQRFSQYFFVQQSSLYSKEEFQPKVLELAFGDAESGSTHIAFAVDDLIITEEIDFQDGVEKLIQSNAYGLYYRLGKNILYCYMQKSPQEIPLLHDLENGYFSWPLKMGQKDWGYSNTLDLAIYKKSEIEKDLRDIYFTNPNEMEGRWPAKSHAIGLCCPHSKAVNVLLNTVSEQSGPNFRLTHPVALNHLFLSGLKINIEPFDHMDNRSPHITPLLKYTPR